MGGDYNEENYGLGANCNNYHVGLYKNSINRTSAYVGKSWIGCVKYICAGGALMLVTGYEYEPVLAPLPVIKIGGDTKLVLIGAPGVARDSPGFVGASIEIPLAKLGWR